VDLVGRTKEKVVETMMVTKTAEERKPTTVVVVVDLTAKREIKF
jgi:hypothetical protein